MVGVGVGVAVGVGVGVGVGVAVGVVVGVGVGVVVGVVVVVGVKSMDKIRVIRIIEYVGPRNAVEATILRSIHGTKAIPHGSGGIVEITAVTVGEVAEILHPKDEG